MKSQRLRPVSSRFSPSGRTRSPRRTSTMRAATILLAGSALVLSACNDEDTTPTETASTHSAEASTEASQQTADHESEVDAATGGKGTTDKQPKTDDGSISKNGMCATNDLKISTANKQGAAGSTLVNVVFENTSSKPCSMTGFPGVSLVTNHNGTQLGKAAQREKGAPHQAVHLEPGASAIAGLKITRTGALDPTACKPQQADGLRVYPPEQTKAAYVPMKGLEGCSGDAEYLSVQPVGLNNQVTGRG